MLLIVYPQNIRNLRICQEESSILCKKYLALTFIRKYVYAFCVMHRVSDPDRYRLFAEYYYAIGSYTYKNVRRSALEAGYSEIYALKRGARIMQTRGIKKALAKKRKEVEKLLAPENIADAQEVLETLTMGLRFQPKELVDENGNLLRIDQIPDQTAYMLKGVKSNKKTDADGNVEETIEYRFPDKRACIAEFAKILGLANGNKNIVDQILERLGILNITINQQNNFAIQPSNRLRQVVDAANRKKDDSS